ncbi:MAG: glycosyltransferase family 4 protein, partial [Calditrichaeota bacterium]|nr:glycosyltransferase family 4 protein [Calditrichota bacterium]
LLFSKPVVTIGGLPSPLDLAPAGAAIEVNTPDEFHRTVARLLEDPTFREALLARAEDYVKSHFDGVDGQASARVVDLIEAQMRQSK